MSQFDMGWKAINHKKVEPIIINVDAIFDAIFFIFLFFALTSLLPN